LSRDEADHLLRSLSRATSRAILHSKHQMQARLHPVAITDLR
jgi:hypothetical protein